MYAVIYGVIITSLSQTALPESQDIRMVCGTDLIVDGYITDSDNAPVDITGGVIRFAVKHHATDSSPALNRLATILDGPSGLFRVQLSQVDTMDWTPQSYIYQLSYTDNADGYTNYPITQSAFILDPALSLPTDPTDNLSPDQIIGYGLPQPLVADEFLRVTHDGTGLIWSSGGAGSGTVTSITTASPITGGIITTTGTIGINKADSSTDGYLSSTDWNTFNNKQNAGSYALQSTSINTSSPLSGGGDLSSNRTLSITKASTSTDGYLSSTDWNTFNNKQPAGSYLTGNQTIVLSGDVSGSGATSITTSIGAGKVTNSMLAGSIAASKLIGTDIATVGTITSGTWNGTPVGNSFITSALTGKTYDGLTLTALSTGFTVAGGTTSKTLTVPLDASVSGTNTGDQTITLTGDVTGSGTGSFATSIGAGKVTNSMLAGSIAASKLVGTDIATVGTITTGTWRGTTIADGYIASALTGKTYNALTLTAQTTGFTIAGGTTSKTLTVSADATVSGTNTGDQTITLTGNVTGSGTGSFATTIANSAVTNAMLAGSIAASKLVGTDIATVGTITSGTWNGTVIADGYIASALTGKTYNGLTLTSQSTGFTIAGGTTSKTLTVALDSTVSGTNTGDQTLDTVYSKGSSQSNSTITLDSTRLGLIVADASSAISGSLFTVQNNGGTNKYLDITSSATQTFKSGIASGSNNIGFTMGSINSLTNQTNSILTLTNNGTNLFEFTMGGLVITGASVSGSAGTTTRFAGLDVTPGAFTSLSNGEKYFTVIRSQTYTWQSGTGLTNQRFNRYNVPVLNFSASNAANTVTTTATVSIAGAPTLGANVASPSNTNAYALWIEAGRAQFDGTIVGFKHLVGTTSTPTKSLNANAGSTGSSTITGTDAGGTITITPGGSGIASGTQISITFNTAYSATPYVVISPGDSNAGGATGRLYVTNISTTGFDIGISSALSSGTTYTVNYMVMG